MRGWWGLALLALVTLAQVSVVTASASGGYVKLSGRAVSVKDDEPISGMTIQAFLSPPGQQEQYTKPIAETATESNGRFSLLVPRDAPLALVKIRVIPPFQLPCSGVRLGEARGAATAYAATGEQPTFVPLSSPSTTFDVSGAPHPTHEPLNLNHDTRYSTFETVNALPLGSLCVGYIGLFDAKEEE